VKGRRVSPVARGVVQRSCACNASGGDESTCPECARKNGVLERKAQDGRAVASIPAVVQTVLQSAGQPLANHERGFMESRFGRDFSSVRVHTGAAAAQSAQAIDAAAYTLGDNIVFGAGRYAPSTAGGRRLLAHELAHVAQQAGQPVSAGAALELGSAHSAHEIAADRAADAVMNAAPAPAAETATISNGERAESARKYDTQI